METNPKLVMNDAFNEALDIVKNRDKKDWPSADAMFIAASNIAMALFSYKMSIATDPTDVLRQMLDQAQDEEEDNNNG